jgi:XTP/dITP diphosphohydrolase
MRRLRERVLVVATHNLGKLEEIERLLVGFHLDLKSTKDLSLTSPKETETSFIGNAKIKAHHAATQTGFPSLADDSGLEVECLQGAPGVLTADWAETDKGRNFQFAMDRVWDEVNKTTHTKPYKARFVSALVLAWPDGHDETFEGSVQGTLVWPKRGKNGHGFDPMFQPDGYNQTFGEMDRWEKNVISHRGVAFNKLKTNCLEDTF